LRISDFVLFPFHAAILVMASLLSIFVLIFCRDLFYLACDFGVCSFVLPWLVILAFVALYLKQVASK